MKLNRSPEIRECELEIVLNILSELTLEIDLGLELPEDYLRWFFGEITDTRAYQKSTPCENNSK